MYPNPQAIWASVAMAFLKRLGKGNCLVADFPPINGQCELVPGPMRNREIEREKCAGAVSFCTMGLPSRLLAVPAGGRST